MNAEPDWNQPQRPETYWDGEDGGNVVPGTTRGLAQIPQGVMPEALPPLEEGEVEIVLIKMRSILGDLMSLRARRDGSVIVYRIVDEYGYKEVLVPAQSAEPLSFTELTALLWGEIVESWEYQRSEDADFEDIQNWFVLCSEFYEGLNEWHDCQFEQWKEQLEL
jgi:hypothetical protein